MPPRFSDRALALVWHVRAADDGHTFELLAQLVVAKASKGEA